MEFQYDLIQEIENLFFLTKMALSITQRDNSKTLETYCYDSVKDCIYKHFDSICYEGEFRLGKEVQISADCIPPLILLMRPFHGLEKEN